MNPKGHTASEIKTITKLGVNRVGSFVRFDIPRIDAGEEFVVRFRENFFRVKRIGVYGFAV